jgi:hypothetical protein
MMRIVLVALLALAAVGLGQVTSVLQTRDFQAAVDSVKFNSSTGSQLIQTPGFGGAANTEDTFQFPPRVVWPDQGVIVYYSIDGSPRAPFAIAILQEDQYYDLPGFGTDAEPRIKFLRGGAVGEGPRAAQPVRLGVAPNPLVTAATVRLALRRAGDLRVEVFDGTGQVVRVLAAGRSAPGNLALRWDGSDSAGTRVSPGVYFVRAAVDDAASLAKVVVTD